VTKAGVKTYAIRYRNLSRQQRRFAIGSHGTLTVDQARAQARQLLAGVSAVTILLPRRRHTVRRGP